MKAFAAIFVTAVISITRADAAGITVNDAKVQGGKLVVAGLAPAANQLVRLDNRFTVRSNASKLFSFSISNYLPSDCIVDLIAGVATGVGVVANCGPIGVSPRGAWAANIPYLANDLVVFQGSTWRAKTANAGKPPSRRARFPRFPPSCGAGNARFRASFR